MNQQQNSILGSSISLIKKMQGKSIDGGCISGEITLTKEDIVAIETIEKENLIELFVDNYYSINIEDINNYLNINLKIEIKTGDISNYFNSIEDFISGNKFECKHLDYFISEIDYRENIDSNIIISQYKNNLLIIDFLQSIAENQKKSGNQLQLFFYKSGKGADLEIEYDFNLLKDLKLSMPTNLKAQLLNSFAGNDKKQLFINELIVFIEKHGKSYLKLIENWESLISNFEKSYSLFVAGFSFEKIKTSSNEHFQKLIDRIYESISKASNYIFGIPIGYILLLNNFDFTGSLIIKNFALLIIGSLFLILIWYVLFKNISETIVSIEEDIIDFLDKIKDVKELREISDRLQIIKRDVLRKQKFKLNIVKGLTIAIYAVIVLIYLFIFIDISIFL